MMGKVPRGHQDINKGKWQVLHTSRHQELPSLERMLKFWVLITDASFPGSD